MKKLLFIIALFSSVSAHSQVVHSLVVNRDSLLVGDQILLIHKVQIPADVNLEKIDYRRMTDSLMATNMITGAKTPAEVEWIGRFTTADNYSVTPLRFSQSAGKKIYQDTFAVSIYQTGSFTLHHPGLRFQKSETAPEVITTERPQVVVGVTTAFAEIVQTHKDSMSLDILKANLIPNVNNIFTPKTWKDFLPYMLLLFILLLILLTYFLFKKKTQQEEIILLPRPIAPAHYYAFNKLNSLKEEELWKVGKDKEFQTQLTYTIREYLEKRFEIKALESTTGEIKTSLKDEVTPEQESELLEILQIADLVKFAKAKTTDDINETFLQRAFAFVKSTQKITPNFDEQSYLNKLSAYLDQQKKLS